MEFNKHVLRVGGCVLGHTVSRLRLLYIILCLLVVSCRSDTGEGGIEVFDTLKLSPVEEQQVQGRIWRDVSARELFTLPREPEVMLYAPAGIYVDRSGYVFVLDFGMLNVVSFDQNGQYVTSYGEGEGQGPGEMISVLDMGSVGDTMVYVLDYAARTVNWFDKYDGTFIESELIDGGPIRYIMTEDGTEYMMVSSVDHLYQSRQGSDISRFGYLLEEMSEITSPLALGLLGAYRNKMITNFTYFPAIAQYNPDGSLVYARTTPDYYTSFEEPVIEEQDFGGTTSGFTIEGEVFNLFMSNYNDQLFVHATQASAIDVYDAETGDYEYSFRLQHNDNSTYVMNDRLYQIRNDTSVVVSSLDL